MPTVKRIVCLANSRKLSGRCIAGKEYDGSKAGSWIRPVSAREHEEVSEREREYEDGSDPKVLDIIDIPLLERRPKAYQQENWLLDPEYYWERAGRAEWPDLNKLADPVKPLWIDGIHTRNGLNDRIPVAQAATIRSSLHLLRVPGLKLSVFRPGEEFGDRKRRVQGHFRHAGVNYQLWVTDPSYERKFLAKSDGDHALGEAILTVSIGEPYKDSCYKLIAAIIQQDQEI